MNAIAMVIVSTVFLALIILLIMAILTIYDQDMAKQNLKDDISKLSDTLFRKEIEAGQLEEKIERLKRGKDV